MAVHAVSNAHPAPVTHTAPVKPPAVHTDTKAPPPPPKTDHKVDIKT